MNQYKHNLSAPGVEKDLKERMASAVYLQVSIISQALIFVTRARGWSFTERPGFLLVVAFLIAQLVRYTMYYLLDLHALLVQITLST